MAIELYDHQISAIDKLQTGSILCGGVGSGKSRTALAYYYMKVCGGKLKINGEGRTTIPKKKIPLYIITTARKRDSCDWENESFIFYDTNPIVDSWNNIKKYEDVKNSFFIFDEQRVVGYGAWAKAFIKIARHNDWILLSATPGDVWMDYAAVFIANGFYQNISDFRRQHVIYSRYTKYPKIERYINIDILERRRNRILVNMEFDRETLSHHIDIFVNYDRSNYDRIETARWNPYEDRPIQNASEFCYLLRKVVNSDDERIVELEYLILKHNKVIVFYNFNYELDLIKDMLDSNSFIFSEWNGHKHQEIPKTDSWVYLVQYTAGAEAWNCIETNVIIFYSQNYSYKIMQQSAGRIDRMNTPFQDLYYYHLLSHSRIDKTIRLALEGKKQFNESAFFNSI